MKKAFTLAEVLITMTIIGVVAAITIPVLENHYTEQTTVTKVKKFNSTFSNAVRLAIAENGLVDLWDLEADSGNYDAASAEKFANYIKPYLNIMKDCGTASDNECMDDTMYKRLDGDNQAKYGYSSNYYKMILNDGSLIWFRTVSDGCEGTEAGISNACAVIWIDINGMKKPNQLGRDTFYLYVKTDGVTYNTMNSCKKSSSGFGCLSYILLHDSMDYLNGN